MKIFYLIILNILLAYASYGQGQFPKAEEQILKQKPFLKEILQNQSIQPKNKGISQRPTASQNNVAEFTNIDLEGGSGNNVIVKSLEDEEGNICAFGYYHKILTIGNQTITSDSLTTYFMAKYNNTGNPISLQNIFTLPSNTNFTLENVKKFDGGFIWTGFTDNSLLVNGTEYAISERSAFILKTDQQGATVWFKDYVTNRSTSGRGQDLPLDVSADSIYISLAPKSISILGKDGVLANLYTVAEIPGGRIGAIVVNDNSLVFTGNFENYLTIGNLSVNETNFYDATFIASIDIVTKEANFLKENSVPDGTFGDSQPIKLLRDANSNIYLFGSSRSNISWEDGVISEGYGNGRFITKFNSVGQVDSTHFFSNYTGETDVTLNRGKISIYNSDPYEYNFSVTLSGSNFIIIDTAMNYLNSFEVQNDFTFRNYVSSISPLSNEKVAISGHSDYNTILTVFDLTNESILFEDESDELSGYFDIMGLEENSQDQTFMAGNKYGSISFRNQALRDTSEAIIASSTNNTVEWISKLYNGQLTYYFGNSLVVNGDKLAFKGNASTGFKIDDQAYDINGNFIAQYKNDGTVDWVKQIGGYELHSLAYDTDGNIYASGNMRNELSIEGQNFPVNGNYDFFVLKLNTNGGLEWFKSYGDNSIHAAYGSNIVFNNNSLYFSGEYGIDQAATLTIEDTSLNMGTAEFGNSILFSMSTDGGLNWAKNIGASDISGNQSSFWGTGMTAAKDNGFYLAGFFGLSNIFDSDTLKGNYTYNHFIAKYDSSGAVNWVKPIQQQSLAFNYGEIEIDESDNVYIQGGFKDDISIDSLTTLRSNGGTNAYIAKFLSDGTLDWAKKIDAGYSFTRTMEVYSNNVLDIGLDVDFLYTADNFKGQAFFGNNMLASLCASPTALNTPTGATTVLQSETISYTVALENNDQVEWVLNPTEAGSIAVIKNDSISITWSETFEGLVELIINTSNSCGAASSAPLAITVDNPCNSLTQPSQPAGETTVTQTDIQNYTTALSDYDSVSWTLVPAIAGTFTSIADDEIAVTWDADYIGVANISVTVYNNCTDSLVSEALSVSVEELCNPLTQPSKPSGPIEVIQNELSAYISTLAAYDSIAWSLSPAEAGAVELIKDDSITVRWSENFLGEATIMVTAFNNCEEAKNSAALTISVVEPGVTANTNALSDQFQIYPNPTSTLLKINIIGDVKIDRMTILNINGQEMLSESKANNSAIDVSQLEVGIYYLEIQTSEGKVTSRFVKN